jgi:hypothetical protein
MFLKISMQRQILLQQMQMHMSAMEKHADTREKYLRRIANFITIHNSKRKRDGIDEEDNDSSNDDKSSCNSNLIKHIDHPMLIVP